MMPGISTPEGRVHFAGEHTSGWMGWMEGALRSGERAASEVLT
jgi:monoamine oxidase